jgi:GNAT superfamily N-acetyltransferase
MSITLRLMIPNDIPAGMRLKDFAGWNQTTTDWKRFLETSPEGCFVAELNGGVVGSATTIVYEGCLAWIGMVLVDPAYRSQGIGTLLLEKTIEHLDARGVPTMKLDATPQGKPIYERLGFVSEFEIERWLLKRAPGNAISQSVVPFCPHDVLKLDREVFGADRSGLLRSIALEAPEFVLVVRRESEVTGYAFGRHGSRADHLGPWMGRDQFAAREIIEGFIDRSTREMIFVDCVESNPWALVLLGSLGFEFSRPFTRMYRGPNNHAGRPEWLCATLGPEFG